LVDYHGVVHDWPDKPPSPILVEEPDPKDEGSWSEWPTSLRTRSFAETIQHGLEANAFTNIRMRDLPLGLSQIVKA
jgi:hypothetical protein